MAEYSTTAAEKEKAALISDSEGEDDDNIVEILDGSPHSTLPPEVWAMVIDCEFVFYLIAIYLLLCLLVLYSYRRCTLFPYRPTI